MDADARTGAVRNAVALITLCQRRGLDGDLSTLVGQLAVDTDVPVELTLAAVAQLAVVFIDRYATVAGRAPEEALRRFAASFEAHTLGIAPPDDPSGNDATA